jgi:hypothetical protein
MGCREGARGGGEAAAEERWSDAAVMGCRKGARGSGEAAAGEGRQETTIIYIIYILLTLIERVLGELISIYYGMLPPDVSSIF